MGKRYSDPKFEHGNQATTLFCSTIEANWYILHTDNFSLLNPHQHTRRQAVCLPQPEFSALCVVSHSCSGGLQRLHRWLKNKRCFCSVSAVCTVSAVCKGCSTAKRACCVCSLCGIASIFHYLLSEGRGRGHNKKQSGQTIGQRSVKALLY